MNNAMAIGEGEHAATYFTGKTPVKCGRNGCKGHILLGTLAHKISIGEPCFCRECASIGQKWRRFAIPHGASSDVADYPREPRYNSPPPTYKGQFNNRARQGNLNNLQRGRGESQDARKIQKQLEEAQAANRRLMAQLSAQPGSPPSKDNAESQDDLEKKILKLKNIQALNKEEGAPNPTLDNRILQMEEQLKGNNFKAPTLKAIEGQLAAAENTATRCITSVLYFERKLDEAKQANINAIIKLQEVKHTKEELLKKMRAILSTVPYPTAQLQYWQVPQRTLRLKPMQPKPHVMPPKMLSSSKHSKTCEPFKKNG